MRFYSDLEVDLLIEEITLAALEAIEQAASEAARAAILASLERETYAIREAWQQQAEALRWRLEADLQRQAVTQAKQAGRKNTLLAAVIGILGGLALGVGGTIYIGGR
jgi:hypothetical protein